MQKIKDATKRISALAGAMAMLLGIGTSMFPISVVSADALNPLTERSLMLTSAAPGFVDTDGSGNAQSQYSQPGSGPNGKKSGETFTFKTSSASTAIKAFTLQWCTTPAGKCISPGNDTAATTTTPSLDRGSDDSSHSDLSINYTSPVAGTDYKIYTDTGGPLVELGSYSGWSMTIGNKENPTDPLDATGKTNFITLKNSGSGVTLTTGTEVKIVFLASNTNFITNPGAGAFFVKINDFNIGTDVDTGEPDDGNALDPTSNTTHIVDGGVTVANVMNDSIRIQTKVLETMSFSVGTVNPSTLNGSAECASIATNSPIDLGDTDAENSLKVDTAYDGYSYWRLSSNSSNGATVYYSGYTLSNTENDQIKPMRDLTKTLAANLGSVDGSHTYWGDGSTSKSVVGGEQFGLAIEDPSTNDTDGAHPGADTLGSGVTSLGALTPLIPAAAYANAAGTINAAGANTAVFAFKTDSQTSPEPIASESSDVIHCSTAKMRYVANIAPDTPAGIYTSKINYLASPEY